MNQTALDLFGRLLITKVRDEAISDWRMIIGGSMKGETSVKVREMLAPFSEQQRNVVISLVPKVVDTVLHHLLWTLEQTNEVKIGVLAHNQEVASLKEVSDGLAGELYSDDGWIARFSKERL